ncbi:MAG: sigma 54-interacting transcriptional regulator, partial [Desulfobacterales bacterium]
PESLSLISQASNAPVYRCWEILLGYGIVGGYLTSFEENGKAIAELGLRILNGEKPADIPLTDKSKFKYMFDWNQLKRWSISEKRLPQGSIVRYKRLSIWEEYRKTFVGAMTIILAQTLALITMFIQRKKRRLAEEALRISEERYELAVTGSRDGLWDWNLLSNTVFYSDRFKELLNYASDDFSDTIDSFRSLLHPEDADATWAALECHLKERVPYNVEYRLQTKSGEYRWFLARGQAIWDRKGLPLRMAGSISDVNARKQAEADIVNRLFFEKMISELSTEFINLSTDETDIKISSAFSRIGTFINVDRCYLFRFNWEKTKFHISNLWEGEGVQKDEIVRGAIVKDVFPWLYHNLLIGKDIVISDVEELSDQEEVRKEYEYCRQVGIQSFIILPIQVSDASLCAIGLDSINNKRTWSEEIIIRLRIIGEVFANTIGRKHAEKKLLESYNEINKLKDKLEIERDYLQEEIRIEHNYENIIGDSESLKYVLYKLEQAAIIDSTVLILGETGTGKELIARAIHRTGLRQQRSLIKVNCATLPNNLIESELFGHEKGAFTGATTIKTGRFEIADNGTLFLDEIGELSLELQAKLLRAIEDGEFERLGGSKTIKVNVRIIAATNRNLEKEMKEGHFREDLWYRLNVFPITMPPLRERKEDIPSLASYFV